MKILEVTDIEFRDEIISKDFLFEDDTSVSVDIKRKEVIDMDGMMTVPKTKQFSIEDYLGFDINL